MDALSNENPELRSNPEDLLKIIDALIETKNYFDEDKNDKK